ncbi:hypothetical protein HOD96_04490 [Candidatus Falkowbacteria bacterium]|jgi:hypothetical protein|nr:hypothetical protein [Candidatus Falkowbacteria bacterium]MBT4433572.1 hypothetical protein [Candidatus Falkowbacteria bacterium]
MIKYILTILFLSLFFVSGASAGSLTIFETIQEINLAPGGAEHFSFVLKNNTGNKLDVSMQKAGFRFKGDEGEVEVFEDPKNELINSWLKPLNPTSFGLAPGERKRLTFLVSAPPDTEDGGYYATIYFTGISNNNEVKSNNSLVFVGVDREDDNTFLREGRVNGLSVPGFIFYGPVRFGARFNNLGNIHYKPKGQIDIYNFLNKRIATIPIQEKNILPNSNLYIYGDWDRKYFLGKYLIVVRMFDGDKNPSVITKVMWAFPWKEAIVIILITVLIIIARKLRVKRLKFE